MCVAGDAGCRERQRHLFLIIYLLLGIQLTLVSLFLLLLWRVTEVNSDFLLDLDILIVMLLILNVIRLIRINSKLPGRDPIQEAVDHYYKEKNERK